MNEQQLQQAFIQFLAEKTGAKTQQELETVIKQLGEDGLKQAYQEFIELLQQKQVQAAKFGAKLDYIKQLRGKCPEGYETSYYKSGGMLKTKCKKCQQDSEMEDPMEKFRCGGKKKVKKRQEGGIVKNDNTKNNKSERFTPKENIKDKNDNTKLKSFGKFIPKKK